MKKAPAVYQRGLAECVREGIPHLEGMFGIPPFHIGFVVFFLDFRGITKPSQGSDAKQQEPPICAGETAILQWEPQITEGSY